MYVVAGATGRVGSATASALLAEGAHVRVLVRRHADAERRRSDGAQAQVAALEDRAALTGALEGCEGFFVLLPFDLTAPDLDAHADTLIASIAAAVAAAEVPHVVMLSSGGADLPEGTGPITGLHRLEQALRATGARVTALRSGHFQEKVADVIDAARDDGVYPVFAGTADEALPMVATADIGDVAARALLSPPDASETVDVLGPQYSERDVAAVLGHALGRDLHVVTLPEDSWVGTLQQTGLDLHVAEALAELYRADGRGWLAPRGDRRIHASTGIEATIGHLLAG